ncbi:asparagine synthase (glutamine-hydrolyzing) [Elusimicrobiota bacterium]
MYGISGICDHKKKIELNGPSHQPISLDNRYKIVYIGVLNNSNSIREELKALGHEFNSNEDPEVIVNSYVQWKEDCVEKYEGKFIFAIYDESNKTLFVARDKMGIMPAYYSQKGNTFIFSSDITSILSFPAVSRDINEEKIYEFLTLGFTFGENTFFKDINRLEQANYCLVKEGRIIKKKKYWEHKPVYARNEEKIQDTAQIEDQLINNLKDAISSQAVNTGIPAGFELSGGIDSSFLVALASKYDLIQKPIKTYSVIMKNTILDESRYIEEVATRNNIEHQYFSFTYKQFYENIYEAAKYYEEPLGFSSTPFMYSFFTQLKDRTLYAGDGSDELFGGYDWYGESARMEKRSSIISKYGNSDWQGNIKKASPDNFNQHLKKCLLGDAGYNVINDLLDNKQLSNNIDLGDYISEDDNYINNHLYFEQQTRMVRCLEEKSKLAMVNGIDVKLPYLHEPFVIWARDLPPYLKVFADQRKFVLKKAASRYFSDSFVYRKKTGFQAPVCSWLVDRNIMGKLLGILSEKRTKKRQWFNNSLIDSIVEDFVQTVKTNACSKKCYGNIIWRLINFEIWQRIFIDP